MTNKKTTAIGEAFWTKINGVLDTYEGNILGYSTRLKLNDKDTAALTKELEAVLEEAKADEKFKGKKWSNEPFLGVSEDTDGVKMFKFKCKHEFDKDGIKTPNVVPLYDAKGKRIADDISIGNGSKVKISFTPVAFNMNARTNGLTLRLNAIQIIDLIEYNGGANAEAFGFSEEQGYTAPEQEFADEEISI